MTGFTMGHLLGGRIHHMQPAAGFRTGIEPVLVAASIGARAGQRVLEGGTGSGAALLCLLTRVPGLSGLGIEIDPGQADLAARNAAANGLGGMQVVHGDLTITAPAGSFDHAFANPPYHAAGGTASPDAARERAKRGSPGLLGDWAAALARALRPRGTLTFILPSAALPFGIAAMAAAGAPVDAILPLWPKPGVAAKLSIIRGIKSGRGALRLLPGLQLHGPDGAFTAEADAILRGGGPLALTDR